MNNNELKKPLIQSVAVILAGIILFAIAICISSHGFLGGIWAFIVGIFKIILYFIGLALGISFCIAYLVFIFLGAVRLVDKEASLYMWAHIKKRLTFCSECTKNYDFKGCAVDIKESIKDLKNIGSHTHTAHNTSSVQVSAEMEEKIASLETEIARLKESETQIRRRLDEITSNKVD